MRSFERLVNGHDHLHWIPGLDHDDPVLEAAYAAADVHVLVSTIEAQGLEKTFVKARSLREILLRPLERAERIEALRGVDLRVAELLAVLLVDGRDRVEHAPGLGRVATERLGHEQGLAGLVRDGGRHDRDVHPTGLVGLVGVDVDLDLLLLHHGYDIPGGGRANLSAAIDKMIDAARVISKPKALILYGAADPESYRESVQDQQRGWKGGIPSFHSMESAAAAFDKFVCHHQRKARHNRCR